jgi:hypothetical protein
MSLPIKHLTREDWLTAAVDELRPFFSSNGVSITPKISTHTDAKKPHTAVNL